MQRRRVLMGMQSELPSAYRRVEYLSPLSKYSYFITDYHPNTLTRYDTILSVDNYGTVILSAGDEFDLSKSGWYVYKQVIKESSASTSALTILRYYPTKLWLTDENITRFAYYNDHGADNTILFRPDLQPYQCASPLIIFGKDTEGIIQNPQYNSARLYGHLRITENGNVVHNYLTCYRKADFEPGLYDTVTKQFLAKSGTGTFSYPQ